MLQGNRVAKELKDMETDVAIIPETKNKLKGTTELSDYVVIYSGFSQGKQAISGVAILISY